MRRTEKYFYRRAQTDINALQLFSSARLSAIDEAYKLSEPAESACKKGCSYCCHQPTYIQTHEAIVIHVYVSRELPIAKQKWIRAQARTNAELIQNMDIRAHQSVNIKCPLLLDSLCSVHEVRPTTCAARNSLDVDYCSGLFESPGQPYERGPQIRSAVDTQLKREEDLMGWLRQQNRDAALYEINDALAMLAAKPFLIGQWQAGKPILKGKVKSLEAAKADVARKQSASG